MENTFMSEQPSTENVNPAPVGEAEPATGPESIEELRAKIAELENDVQKYKTLARKEEQKKKENWERLKELEKAQMSETERAILEAEERGRQAAMAEYEAKLREQKLATAAARAGISDEVIGLLDPAKLFTDDGEPDLDLLASLSGQRRRFSTSASDLGIGSQTNANAGQLTRADLQRMSPAEIQKARQEGRLDALMRGQIH
jgi:hypothetical protein